MAKKAKNNWKAFLTIAIIFIVFCTVAYYATSILFKPTFVRYTAFGIPMPTQYAIHGIDVSRYQKNINWNEVGNMKVHDISLKFAFIKATEGVNKVDPQFQKNWFKASQAGVSKGAYHFFNPSKKGLPQARNFMQMVRLQKGDLPPVLDVETANGIQALQLNKEVQIWLDTVEAHYGVKPILYTNASFYTRYFAGSLEAYPLWVAHYLEKEKPRINRSWVFWQHSECGRVNGIDANVDFNVFNGDSTDFELLKIK